MPGVDILTGVAQVNVSQDEPTKTPPSLDTCVMTVDGKVSDSGRLNLNSPQNPLVFGEDYYFAVALVGVDKSRKGYTVGRTTPLSAVQTLGVGEDCFMLSIPATGVGGLPADCGYAIGALVFIGIEQDQFFQPVSFAQVDPTRNFVHIIASKPMPRVPRFDESVYLTPTPLVPHKILGSRSLGGVSWLPWTPTTNSVRLQHRTSQITVRPDDAPDFNVVTTRATDVVFSALSGDNYDIIQAIGGNYIQVTDAGVVYEIGESDIITAIAQIKGNRALQILMPDNSAGRSTIRLMLGNLSTNQQDTTELTSKTEQYAIEFNLQAAALDYLTRNLHSTTWYSQYTA